MKGKTKCLQNTHLEKKYRHYCLTTGSVQLCPPQPVLDIKFEIKAHVQNSESRDECVRFKIKKRRNCGI